MNKIHKNFSKKSKWYKEWHQVPNHNILHWSAFLAVVIMSSSFLVASSKEFAQSTQYNTANVISAFKIVKLKTDGAVDLSSDQILVKFKSTIGETKRQEALARHSLKLKKEIPQIGVKVLTISTGTAQDAVKDLLEKEGSIIEYAEVDAKLPPTAIPNDPYYSQAYHLPKIQSALAWNTTTGSKTIAILDSGTNCYDINCVLGWNFVLNTSDTHDITGHGTAVASAAAEVTNNASQLSGVAGGASVMPLVIADSTGYGLSSAIASALTYAADHGVKVANISYGSVSKITSIINAAQYFQSKGGVVTAAAGNSAVYDTTADNPYFLLVSATDETDTITSWSNTGNNIDVAAPGQNIWLMTSSGQMGVGGGTSFAAPLVAGVADLVLSANPNLTGTQVQDIIKKSADDLGTPGWDIQYGWGRINAYKAVQMALNKTVTTASDNIPPSAPVITSISPSSNSVTINWSPATDNVGIEAYEILRNSNSGDQSIFVGIFTPSTLSFTDTTVSPSMTYNYALNAYDSAGNSSHAYGTVTTLTGPTVSTSPAPSVSPSPSPFPSPSVSPSPSPSISPSPSPSPSPILSITSYQVAKKEATAVTITWTTNIPSTGDVNYGPAPSNLSALIADSQSSTSHSITVTGLTKGTRYFYKIDAFAGASSVSTSVGNFRTMNK